MKDRDDIATEILKRLEDVEEPEVVEVGVEVGKLSRTLLHRHQKLRLTMVDSWLPMNRQPIGYVTTRDPSAQKTWCEQLERKAQAEEVQREYADRCRIVHDDSIHAAMGFDVRSFDMVFLDGDHSFDGVLNDLSAWRCTIRPGGWFAGHDYDNPTDQQDMSGVKKAVDGYFATLGKIEKGVDFTWFFRV